MISEEYKALLRQMHEDKPRWGMQGKFYARLVDKLALRYECETFLDYGCGKKTLSSHLPHLEFGGYDPGVEEFSSLPDPADMVVCFDVLEHIEPEFLDEVLNHIKSLTKKVSILSVATVPARKHLPNGENAHLIIEPMEWWLPKIMDMGKLFRLERGPETFYVALEAT